MQTREEQLIALVEPRLAAMGFELVQLRLIDGKRSQTLQIMSERPDGTMTLDDCAMVSQQLSAVFDVEDVLPNAYRLEISSPGIDRPLTRPRDFAAYTGHLAKIELALPQAGRKRFTGTLAGLEGDTLQLTVDGQTHALALSNIQSAKLVLTEALIQAHTARGAQ